MSQDLTPRQQILLWDLVSRGGSALQKDIRPGVKPTDREALQSAKQISVTKEKGRALKLTVEDRGWASLATIAPRLPDSVRGSIYDRPILMFLIARIQQFTTVNNIALSHLIMGRQLFDSVTGSPVDDPASSIITVKEEVRDAFFAIAGRPARNHVRLGRLREYLRHVDRTRLDRALTEMKSGQQARFSTLNNPSDIAKEGDAPLMIDGREFHTIWIDP